MDEPEEMPVDPTFPPEQLSGEGTELMPAEEILRLETRLGIIEELKAKGMGLIGEEDRTLVQEEEPIRRRLAQLREGATTINEESGV